MSELLNSDKFWEHVYNRFPEVYKRDDYYTNYALKRFIHTAGEGFKTVIDEINGITYLRDPLNTKLDVLSAIYKSHGLDTFNGLPEEYLRNLIFVLNPTFARKGSLSSIEYLCNVVSGVQCEVDMSQFDSGNSVNLIIDMDYDKQAKFPNLSQLKKIVKEFLPFYCNMSYVFSYMFYDNVKLTARDDFYFDKVKETTKDNVLLDIKDKNKDSATTKYKTVDENTLQNEYGENYVLNSTVYTLSESIILNSCNGYDIITVNGTKIERTYSI